jgi:hypothetical protein
MLKRFVHRNSLNAERSEKETPEAQALDNTAIMNANPKKVRTKPETRVGLCTIMVFRTLLDNELTH